MHKTKDLLKKPIISVKTGKQIGYVKDLHCSWQEGKIKSALVEIGNILSKKSVQVPLNYFKKIAGEWLPLASLDDLDSGEQIPETEMWTKYQGLKIVSNWGREKGFLAEIIFTFPEGKIELLEISDGLLKDFINGRIKVPYKYFENFTENMIVAKEDWEVI